MHLHPLFLLMIVNYASGASITRGESSTDENVIVVHRKQTFVLRDDKMLDDKSVHAVAAHALRRLAMAASTIDQTNPHENTRGNIPSEYAVNLLQPFGGANAGADAAAREKQKAEASSLDKAQSGTSAQKKADRGDIFYEKLIIFRTSHDRVKEQAESDNNRLSKQDLSQVAEREKKAKQFQAVN